MAVATARHRSGNGICGGSFGGGIAPAALGVAEIFRGRHVQPRHGAQRARFETPRGPRRDATAPGNCSPRHARHDGGMPGDGGEAALLALPALRKRRGGSDAGRGSHQGSLRDARQGKVRRGVAAGGQEINLRAPHRAPGKGAANFSRTETAPRHRRGRIRRHAGIDHAGKHSRRTGRPDSGRVRSGKTPAGAGERNHLECRRRAAVARAGRAGRRTAGRGRRHDGERLDDAAAGRVSQTGRCGDARRV